jgi:hypothetical protein
MLRRGPNRLTWLGGRARQRHRHRRLAVRGQALHYCRGKAGARPRPAVRDHGDERDDEEVTVLFRPGALLRFYTFREWHTPLGHLPEGSMLLESRHEQGAVRTERKQGLQRCRRPLPHLQQQHQQQQ